MHHFHTVALSALAAALLSFTPLNPAHLKTASQGVKNVVLVHGASADGSSWEKVIPMLQAKGLTVISVQNPLTSLADDVAATKRAIAMLHGPVLLVGHSWAGVVITEAGNDPKVAGLMYLSALAPDAGQSLSDMAKEGPTAPGPAEYKPDASGFLVLSQKGFTEDFAQDLPPLQTKVMYSVQGGWAKQCPDEKVTKAAWKTRPTWFIVAGEDRMINPDLEKVAAKRMHATTLVLKSSHVSMLSQPKKVADFIISATEKLSAQQLSKR
ncbi:alpha/beta fold hydrolase [Hymenobacter negativus]|uniref:Alpha/beta hydrolase n=1 Tax=Hymenobacter negativus TaxID=2795026 RepID=A0ABS3QM63_9BACT|nr:alpha/beta hydrolase [Hymenobacter negativus]MBO2012108.1 alpha/beta hydrolase [Hymenobacter negativus]